MQRITDSVIDGENNVTEVVKTEIKKSDTVLEAKHVKAESIKAKFSKNQTSKFESLKIKSMKYLKLETTHSPYTKSKQDKGSEVTKNLLKVSTLLISGFGLLSLPLQSHTSTQPSKSESPLSQVLQQKTLIIASVQGSSTHFAIDGFEHGFGYDIVRSYADNLELNLKLNDYKSNKEALEAVTSGKADIALTVASTKLKSDFSLSSINLTCGRDSKLTENGLHPNVSWSFAESHKKLAESASHYLCDATNIKHTEKLAKFYNQNLLKDTYNKMHFNKAMNERLPSYQSSFQASAEKYDHDWELLVAMGYQESHLKADVVSRTGVRGLMMLTKNTAKAMGIRDRDDPQQSIQGGARYLEKLKGKFSDVPKHDRVFFALASYNMGPYAVKSIQKELRKQGKDDKNWTNVYAYMSDNADSNRRYVQCMHYVRNIRSYLENIKLATVA